MARSPAKKHGPKLTCDGAEIFTCAQAATWLKTSQDAIRQASAQGALCPAKVGKHTVFTRRDLERYRKTAREASIARRLVEGVHPLDVYLEAPGKYPMKEVSRVLLEWSRLSGVWLVEGPRGSYARWLERLGILRCTPRELRRVVEALITDPELGTRVRALFTDQRRAAAAE